jgi:hypothetical protein
MVAHKHVRSQSLSIEKTHRRAIKRKFSNIYGQIVPMRSKGMNPQTLCVGF